MKFLLATALLATLSTASEATDNARKNLQQPHMNSNFAVPNPDLQALFPFLKKSQCAIACLEQPTRFLKCEGQGPLQTLCSHFNEIQNDAHSCVEKCGVAPSTITYVGQIAREMCATI
ncbi:hypothetical protein L249_0921 [Ophiocordyceps polyrhachis-furcata BCC 54312]|uniref:Extracellular membrane protein CFEM domain-containing protein n=1 Tax=Ophiocordyceps polyrhachis-furcata BCC 54312 TaxID=1330021 RepID=A0A367LCV4_9HYPO|nr:hypothetical protein L249_0921 [Ophiocordyceps polyrhachis-furcata BCC 54312]